MNRFKLTFWSALFWFVMITGVYATYARFLLGWQASTNLSDEVPWGLWVGMGTLCGVGLSAGGFAIAAAVYILGFERYRPVLRASILISFLGYMTVVTGMMYELGLPWNIWHPLFWWNRASVLFEVAWCVMLYTTVLTLEFSPSLVEKLTGLGKLRPWYLHWHHRFLIALVMIGVLLSSLHQSFLGGLFLIAKGKLYPLWYSPYLHSMFYLSAIPAGLAVVMMAMYLSVRSLKVQIDMSILRDLTRVIVLMLWVNLLFRFVDLLGHGNAQYLFLLREETLLFWTEVLMFMVIPLVMFSQERVRSNPFLTYWTSALVVAGFMAHRLNVSITGLQRASGVYYVPKWTEFSSTLMLIVLAVWAFRWAVMNLDILPKREEPSQKPLYWGIPATPGMVN